MTARLGDVRCVLFDLDGTLIDSAEDLGRAADAMRLERNLPSLPMDSYRAHAGSGARGMLHVAFDLAPQDKAYDALKTEFLDRYEQHMTRRTQPFAGIDQMLAALQDRDITWGIVTNKAERFTHPLVAALTALGTAATIVCADTVGHLKPNPASLLEARRRLDIPAAQCIYVGDDERDVQAGRAAGMRTVAARYGYIGASARIEDWQADAIIDEPIQLLKILDLA